MFQKPQWVRALVWAFLVSQVAGFLMAWSPWAVHDMGFSMQLAPLGLDFDAARGMAPAQRMVGAALGLLPLAVLAIGLWRLDGMLRGLQGAHGQSIFSLQNIGHLRVFAGASALSVVLGILETPARGLLFRHLLGAADARIKLGMSTNDLFVVLICLVFFLITDMMHAARRIAQENEAFV